MSIYVYITRQCAKDTEKQKYWDDIERFKKKIESSQNLDSFDRFPPPHLKKRFERQIRLVAGERQVGEHLVVVFLRLLVRGGAEYKQFGDSSFKMVPGVDKMDKELSEAYLLEYIESRQDSPPPPPPSPSEAEASYLHSALAPAANIYHDSHCCETHLWVECIKQPEFESRLSAFVSPILETIDCPDEGLSKLMCRDAPEFGILFRRIPESKMVILLTPFRGEPPLAEVREKFGALLDPSAPFDHELALQKAKHAYSHDLILNEDAWFQIQRSRDGSMALSLEEMEVLESARDPKRAGFPLFINGRAGSGKSTILQYLFSEYLYHHLLEGHDMAPPVLFACNDLLLSQSKNSVRQLLRARHSKSKGAMDDSWMLDTGFEPRFQAAFRNFYSSLMEMLPKTDLDRYPKANLIDYGRFKAWWERRFSKDPSSRKLYDPDLSWHVIRTYIKGTSPEGLLDPDDYSEMPAKHKSVTPETYGIIFDKVWTKYSEDQQRLGLWDHQDLARHVLEKDLAKPQHPVIMCDEAQDFTRIELELIDRHCLFNARTLHAYEAEKVPIAFAGDPFQTLNPTGFRWESTKAFFVEKFIKNYAGHDARKELNFRELRYNYRSSRNIVRFCNSLQLVRSVVFDIPDIMPQVHWHDEENSPSVVCFDRSNAEILGILKNQSEIRIIVPCEEGAEAEWVRQNGLAEFVEFDDEDVPKNVVSAVRVKGLEFPRVVLFGFGGECPQSLRQAIQSGEAFPESDQSIEPQYFLNRLYVAASRPRRRLFVIDHRKDFETFWNPIFEKQETFTLDSYDTAAWETELGSMVQGDVSSWEKDREDPAETADKLAEEGRLRKDRVLLRQAAQSYDTAKLPTKAKRCRAEAMELEEQWIKSATLWEELGDYERSVTAAWQSPEEGPSFLIRLSERHAEVRNTLEYRFSAYLTQGGGFEGGIELLRAFEAAIEDATRLEEIVVQPSWRLAFGRFVDALLTAKEPSTGLWKAAYNRLKNISESGMRIPPLAMGKVAFAAELANDAFQHWSSLDPSERTGVDRDYLRAKMAALPFPEYIDVADELLRAHRATKDADLILSKLLLEDPTKLKPNQHGVAARAYLVSGKYSEGFRHLELCSDEAIAVEYLETVSVKTNDPKDAAVCLAALLPIMADNNKLSSMLDLMKTGKYGGVRLVGFSRLLGRAQWNLLAPFVKLIGSAVDFGPEKEDLCVSYARYLNEHFKSDFGWKHEVHPLLLGQAYETIGRFKETLPYYEHVKGSTNFPEALRSLARERWVRVKVAQARRELDQGTKKRAENLASEARIELASLPYQKFEDIPDRLPAVLPPVDIAESPTPTTPPSLPRKQVVPEEKGATKVDESDASKSYQFSDRVGPYLVRINSSGNRMNIDDAESLAQVAVFLERGTVSHDGESIPGDETERFHIGALNLTIDLGSLNEGEVSLRLSNGMKTSLPVAPFARTSPDGNTAS